MHPILPTLQEGRVVRGDSQIKVIVPTEFWWMNESYLDRLRSQEVRHMEDQWHDIIVLMGAKAFLQLPSLFANASSMNTTPCCKREFRSWSPWLGTVLFIYVTTSVPSTVPDMKVTFPNFGLLRWLPGLLAAWMIYGDAISGLALFRAYPC